MTSLITPEQIQQLDSKHMLESIDALARQVEHAWSATHTVQWASLAQEVDTIVVFGMGGSALAADVVRAVLADRLKQPIIIEHGYQVPAYVNRRTLAILSSYSGTTEETLAIAKQINQHTGHIAVISAGGALAEWQKQYHYPGYTIEPTYNPCGQPRIAVGYAIIGLMGVLRGLGLLTIEDELVDDTIHYLDGNRELLRDAALGTAQELSGKVPLYIGSEFLTGNLHIISNQTNENGKNLATYFTIPELNHHLLEGFGFPSDNAERFHLVFIESHLYHERIQKRFDITKEVLTKQHIPYSTFTATAANRFLQSFEVLQWGSYLGFYLAIQNQLNPSDIPWVDYFKNALRS